MSKSFSQALMGNINLCLQPSCYPFTQPHPPKKLFCENQKHLIPNTRTLNGSPCPWVLFLVRECMERKKGCTTGCCIGTGRSKGIKQAGAERVHTAQRYRASIPPTVIRTTQLELDLSSFHSLMFTLTFFLYK